MTTTNWTHRDAEPATRPLPDPAEASVESLTHWFKNCSPLPDRWLSETHRLSILREAAIVGFGDSDHPERWAICRWQGRNYPTVRVATVPISVPVESIMDALRDVQPNTRDVPAWEEAIRSALAACM